MERAVVRLHELGYLDDQVLARDLVARRALDRGPDLIRKELEVKGLGGAPASAALAELGREQQVEAARRLVERSAALDSRRLAARLQRRGFSEEVVREVLPDED